MVGMVATTGTGETPALPGRGHALSDWERVALTALLARPCAEPGTGGTPALPGTTTFHRIWLPGKDVWERFESPDAGKARLSDICWARKGQ